MMEEPGPSNRMEIDAPPAFVMWKVLYTTLTTLFNDLDNAQNNLETFANTLLSSKECTDIFVPRYDISINFEQNQTIEQKYQGFTTWLLGRFFYILGCENLERIHDLYIQAQQKILIVLRYQPHIFKIMIIEYNNTLSIINDSLKKEYNTSKEINAIQLNYFTVPEDISDSINLNLSQICSNLQSRRQCYMLQCNILKILSEPMLLHLESFCVDSTTKSVLNNIVYCLRNSNIQSKLVIIQYFTKLIHQSYYQLNKSVVSSHFREIFSCLEQIITIKSYNHALTAPESAEFSELLTKLFDAVKGMEIIKDNTLIKDSCYKMCHIVIFESLQQLNLSKENKMLFKTSMNLLINILQHNGVLYPDIQFLIQFIITNKTCEDVKELVEFQVLEEIKSYVNQNEICLTRPNNVCEISALWNAIFQTLSNNLTKCTEVRDKTTAVYKLLNFLQSSTRIARRINTMFCKWYIEKGLTNAKSPEIIFFSTKQLLLTIKMIINIYQINTNLDTVKCVDVIQESLFYLFCIQYVCDKNTEECKSLFDFICYPFTNFEGVNSSVKYIITKEFTDELCLLKQKETLTFLSTCMVNFNTDAQKNVTEIVNIILGIFKNCASKQQLQIEVATNLLNLASTIHFPSNTIYEIVKQLLSTNNPQVLAVLCKDLGKIICVLSGNYTIESVIKNNIIDYEIFCLQCDFMKNNPENEETNGRKLYRVCDGKCFTYSEFIMQKNLTQEINFSMLINLLNKTEDEIKINVVKQLPRLVKHLNVFNTFPVTNKWLKFMEDNNGEVRKMLSQVLKDIINNCQNNDALVDKYKKSVLDSCLNTLKEYSKKYLLSGKAEFVETLLDSVKEFGCVDIPDNLFNTSRLILFYLIMCNTYLSLTAMDHLNKIAKFHKVTPNYIFIKYKKNFCQVITYMSCVSYCGMDYNIVQSLERISLAFGFTIKDFISRNGHHLLPYYIPLFVKEPKSAKMLTDLANLLVIEPGEILSTHFSYIYTNCYLNENSEIFAKSMKFVEQITKSNLKVLKMRNIKVIHSELLMHFHDKKSLVLKELYKLSQEESESPAECPVNETSQVADYLQPRFLGVLVYFDSKLINKSVDQSVKTRVLQSLPDIIKLMGTKYITPLRHKVLATLRTTLTLTETSYLALTCANWDAFIHCCEVESLGPLLSTIFVSMLPLLEQFPRKTNSIFKYLIVENNEKLKDNIQDLFFLTDTKVDSELKNVVKSFLAKYKNNSFKEQLNMQLKYINHEDLEVRVFGLKFLKKCLENNRIELEQIIMGSNGMDSVIVEVIDVLIAGCKENDEHVRLACGECIGELGAIEPSHFPRKYTQADSVFTFFLTDDSFVVNALYELLRSFQMEKRTLNMNRYALAIQELLKAYGVSPEETAAKHNLWSSFPENMQELMLPLLSSRYTMAIQSSDVISEHPIHGSYSGITFTDWIYNWTSYLISLIKNDKKSLLQVCKPSLKHDYRTLMIFLPHILIHALLECNNNQRKIIYEEFMAVLNMKNENKKLNVVNYRFIKTKLYTPSIGSRKNDDNSKNNSINVIFTLLDYLRRWLQEYKYIKCKAIPNPLTDDKYKTVYDFMELFCKLELAKCNFLRGEYPRALVYLEQYVEKDKRKLNEQLGFFARIYAELEEPDAVSGSMAMQNTEPSLEDMILAHNVTGQIQDAAAGYEIMSQDKTLDPQYLQDMVRCYLELDNPFTALKISSGLMDTYCDKTMLYELQTEPLWRLSKYDDLNDLLSKPEMKSNTSWGARIGQALLHFRNGNRIQFTNEINNGRKILIEMLSSTSLEEGVYRYGYPYIIKLHILNELQKAEDTIYRIKNMTDKNACQQAVKDLIEEWDIRIKVVQSSVRVTEPILRLRRIILEQSQHILGTSADNVKETLDKHISKYWMKSAESARKAGIFQQAYIYIMRAEQYKPIELFVEKAKLYWAKEDQELSFNTLKRGMEEYFPDAISFKNMEPAIRREERKICAEAKLLIATYNDETSNVDMNVNINDYREAVDMYKEWEKSHVCLAQYYDRTLATMSDENIDNQNEVQVHIINSFGKSLQYGSTYIYQSMPRMLSIWLDYGTKIMQSRPKDSAEVRKKKNEALSMMITLIDTYLDRLPAYMFLSAFSQLVSRICHPVREVYVQIKSILIKVILKYPQQALWMIMAVSKSTYAFRTKRCQEILQDHRLVNSSVMRLVFDFNRLVDKLIELCNKPIGDVVVASVSHLTRTLPKLLQSKDFSEIILPLQKLRKLVLPNVEFSNAQHNPFPNSYIYIAGIEDEVHILQSLQKPRKIAFRGSDGKKYVFMLKPKDDLRKDFRLMEFNDVVNLYLQREAESRQRRLCIRTYSVAPLNEECGIIEWIDNLVGLRPILIKIYKQRGIYKGVKELKPMMSRIEDSDALKLSRFVDKLLPGHPPVLSDWYRFTFPDAHCWYHARMAYIHTSAVISMVGYMLGLGDRHGENILFDSTNGDSVHVDFNCLFNKGETFDWPEKVPFRLTHNMVDAMGPLGVEGIFRKSCAVTLKVLRAQTDSLMSIVRPFVYDPLVSWSRNQLMKQHSAEAEFTNEQAVEHIKNIELRLQGMIKSKRKSNSISLSCEGQANHLIAEATNINNLSQMYIGWGAYL